MWCRRPLVVGVVLVLGTALPGMAQAGERDGGAPTVTTAVRTGVSPPLRELANIPVAEPTSTKDREIPIFIPEFLHQLPNVSQGPDPLRQERPGLALPSALFDFEGYGSDDNQTLFGSRLSPPDTEGDVGPNHYVSWNNVGYYVYDKTGTPIEGPTAGNDLWNGFGGPCQTDNAGDPVVLYDHLADRWMFSQFVDSAADGHQCIAVSRTPDPTGDYWLYDFIISPSAFNDYPKIGLWPDGYYLTANEFAGGFQGARIVAFERSQMLAGDTAQAVSFFLPNDTPGYFSVLPGHLEGPPPPAGKPNPYIMACDDTVWGCGAGGSDGYHLWDFHVDWATPANSTFTYNAFLTSADFDTNLCGFNACVPQPGTSTTLDTLSQFTMYRAQYQNFGSHETIVVSHTVDVDGADTAGVRWAEIRDTGASGWSLWQAGTYDLGDGVHRWMPAAALDGTGQCLCIIYSASDGTSVYPSVRYACHEEGVDALGVMGAEQECVAGGGSQLDSSRWGDYSALSIDPGDLCTFWGTGEYVAVGGSYFWNTRVCVWQCPSCLADTGTIEGTVTDASTEDPIAGAWVRPGGYTTITNATGFYTQAVLDGTYDVTASRFGYFSDTAEGVTVTVGTTTTQSFSLTAAPTYTLDGNVYDGADAGWPLAADINIVASDSAGNQAVVTDPGTGSYTAALVDGETYDVTASVPGYLSDTQPVTVAGAPITLNFYLIPDESCTALGYGPVPTSVLIDEDFESAVPPAGWTVIDNASSGPVNWTNLAGCGEGGNYTNGAGDVACASSANAGAAEFDTELLTPAFDVTGFEASELSFTANYSNFSGFDFFEVDLSTNGAAGPWTNLLSWNEDHGGFHTTPGEDVLIDLGDAGATGGNNMVRFHYFDPSTGDYDWYVQVDDVLISGDTCEFKGGGIFYGFVTEAENGDPLNAARVEADTGEFTSTRKTYHEPGLDDGYYYLWIPDTAIELTASLTAYQSVTRSVVPAAAPTREDFVLCSGVIVASPASLALRVNIPTGGSPFPVIEQLTIGNDGCGDAGFSIVEFDTSAAVIAPIPPPPERTSTAWRQLRETDRSAWLRATARTASALGLHGTVPSVRQPAAAGDLVDSWATGLDEPWGIDTHGDPRVWIGDLSTKANYEYQTDGTATPNSISSGTLPEVWMADMAADPVSGMIWQVGVGNHGCIWEFNPVSLNFTGNKICPNFGAYMRGLAYDPFSETFWAGTWESGGFIVRFDHGGNILGRWEQDLPVAGLTYNLATGHLFALLNTDSLWDLWVLDVTDPALTVVTAFSSGMPDFAQGGLGHDFAGNLWAVNQNTREAWVIDSNEAWSLFEVDWLSVSPDTGTVLASGQVAVDVTCEPVSGLNQRLEATLMVKNETPYGPSSIEVKCEVNAGLIFADDFESGDVSAWSSSSP